MKVYLFLILFLLSALGRTQTSTGGVQQMQQNRLLGVLRGANFNSTADQAITMVSSSYIIRSITIKNASISLTTAVGGFYTATSKGGVNIVTAAQVYTGLTATGKFIDVALLAILTTDIRTENTLYFSLTVAQGLAATADIYIFGDRVE